MVSDKTKIAGAINLLTLVTLITAVGLAVSAAIDWFHRRDVLTHWPVADATIRSCTIHRDYPFRRNGGGVVFWIVCAVDYSADGVALGARVQSTTRHAGGSGTYWTVSNGSLVTVRPETLFKNWIAQHRPGSRLSLRYPPSHPDAPTFVGADEVVDVNPVPGSIAGVFVFGILTAVGRVVSARLTRNPT